MKQSEIIELSTEEFKEQLGSFQQTSTDLKMAHSISPLETPLQLRALRRTVARVATELTKRELQ